jgi:Zn-dependent peptidase ImmA (M78 family)
MFRMGSTCDEASAAFAERNAKEGRAFDNVVWSFEARWACNLRSDSVGFGHPHHPFKWHVIGLGDTFENMASLSLSPHMLEWAANKVGLSLDELAVRVAAPTKKAQFISGQLTATQAERVASISKVPFGYLFLKQPPEIPRPYLPDLRQLQEADPLSDDFYNVLRDVMRKQEWFADYLHRGEAEGPAFVGKYSNRRLSADLLTTVAGEIAQALALTPQSRQQHATPEAFYSFLSQRLEAAGILVFKSGIVGANTRRPLSVGQFRGFALVDALAPVIFVNGADWPSAWTFTLIHEAAHIWFGESGVSNISASTASAPTGDIEVACNRIAAEVLTPHEEFVAQWRSVDASHLKILSRHFRVSQLVVARRALDLGLIDKGAYAAAANASRLVAEADSSGGDSYRSMPIRNSKRLTKAVVARAMAGDLLLRDAGSLLNTTPRSVVELARRFDAE